MPFIEIEKVAQIRNELKKQFPEFKFSVTRKHYTCLDIAIISGPIKLIDEDYKQINQYYINENYEGKTKDILLKVNEIASRDERTMFIDSDYGAVPNFYIHISIGQWDRPYKITI